MKKIRFVLLAGLVATLSQSLSLPSPGASFACPEIPAECCRTAIMSGCRVCVQTGC